VKGRIRASGVRLRTFTMVWASALIVCPASPLLAQVTGDVPASRPDAIIDLATREGVRVVNAEWRYSDTRIVETDHHAAGADLKASGAPTKAYDFEPHAGAAAFDDRGWEVLDPARLDARRSKGRLAFNWYRINITIPANVAAFDTAGSTVVFEVVVDDYAEVWVDGQLPPILGQAGGQFPTGSSSAVRHGRVSGSSSRSSEPTVRSPSRRPTSSGFDPPRCSSTSQTASAGRSR
jgi:gluconolactonase